MASNVISPDIQKPLSFMDRLSKYVYLYTPPAESSSQTIPPSKAVPPPPKLILLISWMGARDKDIVKYITRYQALFPTSQILLIKNEPKHLVWPPAGYRAAQPAIRAIRAAIPSSRDEDEKHPQLMVHIFSNGGSSMLRHVYDAYEATAARPDEATALPLHNTIFDSAPGEWDYRSAVRAFGVGLPAGPLGWLFVPLVHLVMVMYWVLYTPWGRKDPLEVIREPHNDTERVRETRRAYIHSDKDELIPPRPVLRHAREARERGYVVRTYNFGFTGHVAHARLLPERYWRVVKETWEGWDAQGEKDYGVLDE